MATTELVSGQRREDRVAGVAFVLRRRVQMDQPSGQSFGCTGVVAGQCSEHHVAGPALVLGRQCKCGHGAHQPPGVPVVGLGTTSASSASRVWRVSSAVGSSCISLSAISSAEKVTASRVISASSATSASRAWRLSSAVGSSWARLRPPSIAARLLVSRGQPPEQRVAGLAFVLRRRVELGYRASQPFGRSGLICQQREQRAAGMTLFFRCSGELDHSNHQLFGDPGVCNAAQRSEQRVAGLALFLGRRRRAQSGASTIFCGAVVVDPAVKQRVVGLASVFRRWVELD